MKIYKIIFYSVFILFINIVINSRVAGAYAPAPNGVATDLRIRCGNPKIHTDTFAYISRDRSGTQEVRDIQSSSGNIDKLYVNYAFIVCPQGAGVTRVGLYNARFAYTEGGGGNYIVSRDNPRGPYTLAHLAIGPGDINRALKVPANPIPLEINTSKASADGISALRTTIVTTICNTQDAGYDRGRNHYGDGKTWDQGFTLAEEQASLNGMLDMYQTQSCTKLRTRINIPLIPPNKFEENGKHISSSTSVHTNTNDEGFRSDGSSWRQGTLTAPVGNTSYFKHKIYNYQGLKNQKVGITYKVIRTVYKDGRIINSPQTVAQYSRDENINSSDVVRQGYIHDRLRDNNYVIEKFKITPGMAGQKICEYINYRLDGTRNGNSNSSISTGSTNQSCVYVPYSFDLVPCITTSSSACGNNNDIPVVPGGDTPVDPNISGNGTPSPDNSKWVITRWKVDGRNEGNPLTPSWGSPGSNEHGRGDNNESNTCSFYNSIFSNNIEECDPSQSGVGSIRGNPPTHISVRNITVPLDAKVGDRYCIGLSISPYSMNRNESQEAQIGKVGREWRHSSPICVIVVKYPKLQIWGNGIYSRGGIQTSVSNSNGSIFGSWVEYEAMSGKNIAGFSSGSENSNRKLNAEKYDANSGNFGAGPQSVSNVIDNIKSRYPKSSTNVIVQGDRNSNIDSFSIDYSRNTNSNISTHIVYAKNIRITGNILVRNPTGVDIKNFQQVIIIADNIYIAPNVKQIDAWLISSGRTVTCSKSGFVANFNDVTYDNCKEPLIINGPIISGKLNSWRTGEIPLNDSSNINESPSEIYNQRADIYLWAFSQGSGDGKITTSYSKELPVRY